MAVVQWMPIFCLVLQLRSDWLKSSKSLPAVRRMCVEQLVRREGYRTIMDDGVQKSCWGLTAKAVIAFAGIILLAWLVGGNETAAVLAAS
jgi:hypothetical protein